MTDKIQLERLNKLLNIVYKFGYEVGYSFYDHNKVTDINGHLKNETLYQHEALEAAKDLAPLFGLTAEEICIYMLEDTGYRSENWDYIPPQVAKKEE